MRWALPLLIVVVFVAAIVASLLPNPKATAEGCPGFCPNLGLDLVGGLRGEYQVVATDNQAVTPDILNQTRAIIEARVNATGVAEPNVQTQGGDRITVELPGAADATEIRNLVGTTGRLDFIGVPTQYSGQVTTGQELPRGMDPTPGTPWTSQDLKDLAIFSGDQVSAARPGTNQAGLLAVDLELKERAAKLFDDYAAAHFNQQFAIVLDGDVIEAPSINATSFNGRAQISGGFTTQTMNDLVIKLKFGSLPLEIKEVGFSSLSATLGLGFLAQTVLAGLIGIAFVFAFMLINYRLPGVIACVALLFYVLINFAIFRTIPVTLTLAGIAGFVLSIGMAVDANILIFERSKEELRAGKPLNAAVEAGFNRAWSSIFDSNVSTLMTAFILWYFGSSTVKGFALVLMIGVLTSMFTAVTLSRMMIRWVVRQKWARKASYYGIHEDQFVVAAPPRRSTRGEVSARV
jgi:preprotein translocase subunit SecD